jgi:hypothetical protein
MKKSGKGLRFLVYFFVCVFALAGAGSAAGVFGSFGDGWASRTVVGSSALDIGGDGGSLDIGDDGGLTGGAIDIGDGSDLDGSVMGDSKTDYLNNGVPWNTEVIANPMTWTLADTTKTKNTTVSSSGYSMTNRAVSQGQGTYYPSANSASDKSEYSTNFYKGNFYGEGIVHSETNTEPSNSPATVGHAEATVSILYRINFSADLILALQNGWLSGFAIDVVGAVAGYTNMTFIGTLIDPNWGETTQIAHIGVFAQEAAPARNSVGDDAREMVGGERKPWNISGSGASATSGSNSSVSYTDVDVLNEKTWDTTAEERVKLAQAKGFWVKVYARVNTQNRYKPYVYTNWVGDIAGTNNYANNGFIRVGANLEYVGLRATYNNLPTISFNAGVGGTVGDKVGERSASDVTVAGGQLTQVMPIASAYATANTGYYFRNWTTPDTTLDTDSNLDIFGTKRAISVSANTRWIDLQYRTVLDESGNQLGMGFVFTANFYAAPTLSDTQLRFTFTNARQGPGINVDSSYYPEVVSNYKGRDGTVFDGGDGTINRPIDAGLYTFTATLFRGAGDAREEVGQAEYKFEIQKADLSYNPTVLAKTYNGNTDFDLSLVSANFSGFHNAAGQTGGVPILGTHYKIVSASIDNMNVGTMHVVTVSVELLTEASRNYNLPIATVSTGAIVTILPAEVLTLSDIYLTYGMQFAQNSGGTEVKAIGYNDEVIVGTIIFGSGNESIPARPTVALNDGKTYTARFLPNDVGPTSNYKNSTVGLSITLHIAKAQLTVVGITAQSKVYDGNTKAVSSLAEITGLVYGQTLDNGIDYQISNVFFVDPNVASDIEVTANIALRSNDKTNNYIINTDNSFVGKGFASITPVALSVSAILAGGNTKVYDGTRNATAIVSFVGFVNNEFFVEQNGETNGDYIVSALYDDFTIISNRMPVTVSYSIVKNTKTGNYTYPALTLKFYAGMTRKTLSVSLTANSKEYDGKDTVDSFITVDGLVAHYSTGKIPDFYPNTQYFYDARFQRYELGVQQVRAAYGFLAAFSDGGIDYRNFYQFNENGLQNSASWTTAEITPAVIRESVLKIEYGGSLSSKKATIAGLLFTGRNEEDRDMVSGTFSFNFPPIPDSVFKDLNFVFDIEGASFTPDEEWVNYTYSPNVSLRIMVVPKKLAITVEDFSTIYDGKEKTLSAAAPVGLSGEKFGDLKILSISKILDGGIEDVTGREIVDAGVYKFVYTLAKANTDGRYEIVDGTGTLTIEKAPIVFTFDRTDGTLTINNSGEATAFRIREKGGEWGEFVAETEFAVANDKIYEIDIQLGSGYENNVALIDDAAPFETPEDSNVGLIVGVASGVGVALAGAGTGIGIAFKKKKKKELEAEAKKPGAPKPLAPRPANLKPAAPIKK